MTVTTRKSLNEHWGCPVCKMVLGDSDGCYYDDEVNPVIVSTDLGVKRLGLTKYPEDSE